MSKIAIWVRSIEHLQDVTYFEAPDADHAEDVYVIVHGPYRHTSGWASMTAIAPLICHGWLA